MIRRILCILGCCLRLIPGAAYAEDLAQKQHILIAYFTWADNTHVDDPAAVDIDATTSASVLVPGNTAKMAQWIQEAIGGDLFPILTVEPYSSDYDTCLNRAIQENEENARPALQGKVGNLAQYDTVFLGFPNWWYSCPTAVFTFIEENDLSGKTVIPFCSHGTGGMADSVNDMTRALPESCNVMEAFGAYRPEVDRSQDELLAWIERLKEAGIQ